MTSKDTKAMDTMYEDENSVFGRGFAMGFKKGNALGCVTGKAELAWTASALVESALESIKQDREDITIGILRGLWFILQVNSGIENPSFLKMPAHE